MSPKQCSQQRNDIKDAAIAGPNPNLGFRPETTRQVRESKVPIYHSDAFKKEKRHPRAPSSLAPTKDGQNFHLNHRAPESLSTGMGHTIRVSSHRRRRSTSQKKPPCRAPPHHGQTRPAPPHQAKQHLQTQASGGAKSHGHGQASSTRPQIWPGRPQPPHHGSGSAKPSQHEECRSATGQVAAAPRRHRPARSATSQVALPRRVGHPAPPRRATLAGLLRRAAPPPARAPRRTSTRRPPSRVVSAEGAAPRGPHSKGDPAAADAARALPGGARRRRRGGGRASWGRERSR